ncbi:MAG TPA: hypothetical protein VMG08_19925 [Allosphingosinicella sp.]|nr:hypothetical protein [Allosphingosinicella sp.]
MNRLLLLAPLLAPVATPAAARTLAPRDECAADAGFAQFRSRLLDAVVRHDAQALLALTADDIRFNFGDGGGKQGFVANWGLATPDTSGLWPLLAGVLASGCVREQDHAVSPYVFARFPDTIDPFTSGVARPDARLYRTRADAGESTPIPWEILEEVNLDGRDGWARVRLQDGRTGFLRADAIISPIDYRAIFEQRDGAWRLVAFIAGD